MKKSHISLILFAAALLLSFPLQADTPTRADSEGDEALEARSAPEEERCRTTPVALAKALPDLATLLSTPEPAPQTGECGYLWVDPACGPCGGHANSCEAWCSDKGGVKTFQGCDGFLYCECNNGCVDSSGCTCPPPPHCNFG